LQALFHDFYSSARRLKPDQFWENTLNKMAAQGNDWACSRKKNWLHTKVEKNAFSQKSYFSQEFFANMRKLKCSFQPYYIPSSPCSPLPHVRTAISFFPIFMWPSETQSMLAIAGVGASFEQTRLVLWVFFQV
jgi:hypothetical protein